MLIVRLFLVMPLARLLGPWFWWPQRIPSRERRDPVRVGAGGSEYENPTGPIG
jgi:RND superfamily putative drug exporter